MKQINKALGIRAFISICAVGLMASCAGTPKTDTSYGPKDANTTIASKYAIYAMMAANSYHDENKINFPLNSISWQLVDLIGKPTTEPTEDSHWLTGLSYDIFERQNSNEVVIAIRGTDSLLDYFMGNLAFPISPQYKQAKKEIDEYRASHPDKKITITGHSLGGGIALSTSAWLGLDAITFDSSPRIFDGTNNNKKPANRILVYQEGEILEEVREVWPKIFEVVPKENIYLYSYNFNGESSHRGDCLAYGLLKSAATVNPELARILTETQSVNQTNRPACMN